MTGDLFHSLGSAIGRLEARMGRNPGTRAKASRPADTGQSELVADAAGTAANAAIATTAGWLLSRVFRPRPVGWPRVILAGVAATTLGEMVGRTTDREVGRGRVPYADDPEELLGRYGAGIALTAAYAALLYPRLPGSPLLRGLAFGALEVFAAPRGGLGRIAADAPGLKFPLQTLALPVDEDAGPLSHLAFGVGLGLFYRYEPGE